MAGAAPTFAECWTQAGLQVAVWEKLDAAFNADATNILGLQTAAEVGIGEGVYTPAAVAVVGADCAALASMLSDKTLQERWRPFLREMARIATGQDARDGLPNAALLAIIRKYMVDNTKSIKTRALTLSAPAASGSPVGDGTLLRLTTDKDGKTLEGVGAETLTFVCDKDQNSGAKEYAEEFLVTGAAKYPNALQWTGSALTARIVAAHARSTNILRNPSFDINSGTDNTAFAATTSCTDWVATTAASWKFRSDAVDATYIYRGFPNAQSVKWGIENTASDSIKQTILSANAGASFKRDVPYFLRVKVKRKASATGTAALDFGASTANVDISTLTNDVWTSLYIAIGTGCWFDNFNQDALDVVISTTTLATGTIVFDDVVLAEMTPINGNWYVWDGGAAPFLLGDKWTVATSEGTRGKNGYWLWRAHGAPGYLPASATPTEADPA